MMGAMGYGMDAMMQKMIISKMMSPYFKDAREADDGSLTARDLKRVQSYAQLCPTTLGANYAILRGRSMTMEERAAQTLLGGVTPLYDDFFDRVDLSEDLVLKVTEAPHDCEPNNAREWMFIRYMRVLRHLAADIDTFLPQFHEVYKSQLASKQQERQNLDQASLKKILYEKGGHAALLFRVLLPDPLRDGEAEAMMQWGWVIQLLDDTFDVYEDHQEGIQTLATTANSMEEYAEFCYEEFRELAKRFRAIDYPKGRTNKALNRMLFTICWGLVALEQFKKLPQKGHRFNPADYERKQLICDMDKTSNQLKGMAKYMGFKW